MHTSKNVKSPSSHIFIGSVHFRQPFLSISYPFSQPSEPFSLLKIPYFFTESVPYPSENSALIIFAPSFMQLLTHFTLYSSCPFLVIRTTSFCHAFVQPTFLVFTKCNTTDIQCSCDHAVPSSHQTACNGLSFTFAVFM